MVAAITDDQTVVVLYGAENEAVGFSVDGTVYTYVKNLQGDVIRILDEYGEAVVSYTYDPWGVPTVSGDAALAAVNPCSYRGYYYDQETGYYYLQSRYYDPEIGRFLNSDAQMFLGASGTVLGFNLFTYCENNPVMFSDRTGYFSIPSWMVSVPIDAAILWIASHFQITWMSYMAPLKFMGKTLAAARFREIVAPALKGLLGVLVNVGVKALNWIGRTALAASFNMGAKLAIAAIINDSFRAITALTSVGGLIAAILDYCTDKRFDGWIKLW